MGHSKKAFLIYPGISLFTACTPFMVRYQKGSQVPPWVRDEKLYRSLETCVTNAIMLATGVLMGRITQQVPGIIRGDQHALLPQNMVPCYLGGVGGLIAGFYI